MERKSMQFNPDALSALEAHANAVTDDVNRSHLLHNTPMPSLPRRVRSRDLPADVFKLICMNARTTGEVCKFFGETVETVNPVLEHLRESGFIETRISDDRRELWFAIAAARGRQVVAKPVEPPPIQVRPLNVGGWRESKAFMSVEGGVEEITIGYPASLDEHVAKPVAVEKSEPAPADPSDAEIAEVFKYPMPKMIAAAREEWVRRHPTSPKAKSPKSGQ